MRGLALALRWFHLLAAMAWIGGMLFVALVLVPVVRRLEDAALRARLMRDLGRRFRAVGWITVGLLVATGIGNLLVAPYFLESPRFHAKLTLVLVSIALAAVHDFWLGPRAGVPGADPRWRTRASWVARVNVLVVVAIVALGLALRG